LILNGTRNYILGKKKEGGKERTTRGRQREDSFPLQDLFAQPSQHSRHYEKSLFIEMAADAASCVVWKANLNVTTTTHASTRPFQWEGSAALPEMASRPNICQSYPSIAAWDLAVPVCLLRMEGPPR
jgi:hypothetical protein